MNLRILTVSILGLLSVSPMWAESYSSKESFHRSSAFEANGEVSLENINGDIDVRTWDKNEILIEGEKSAKTDEELKRIDLVMEVSPARAMIRVKLPKRSGGMFSGNTIRAAVRFQITVPRNAVLSKISTVNSSVRIDGASGSVHATSVNGGVKAEHLGGNAHLETVNGTVAATFDRIVPQQKLSLESVNGRVNVKLPADAGVQFKASVVNGHVDCDFPIESASTKRRKNLSGKIGDGRASLEVTTVNGSVHIERS